MKRIIWILAAVLLLSGCAREVTQEQTTTTQGRELVASSSPLEPGETRERWVMNRREYRDLALETVDIWEYAYNEAGQLTQASQWRNGETVHYTFTTWPDGTVQTVTGECNGITRFYGEFIWDGMGNLLRCEGWTWGISNSFALSYAYDIEGNLLKESEFRRGVETKSLTYTYSDGYVDPDMRHHYRCRHAYKGGQSTHFITWTYADEVYRGYTYIEDTMANHYPRMIEGRLDHHGNYAQINIYGLALSGEPGTYGPQFTDLRQCFTYQYVYQDGRVLREYVRDGEEFYRLCDFTYDEAGNVTRKTYRRADETVLRTVDMTYECHTATDRDIRINEKIMALLRELN